MSTDDVGLSMGQHLRKFLFVGKNVVHTEEFSPGALRTREAFRDRVDETVIDDAKTYLSNQPHVTGEMSDILDTAPEDRDAWLPIERYTCTHDGPSARDWLERVTEYDEHWIHDAWITPGKREHRLVFETYIDRENVSGTYEPITTNVVYTIPGIIGETEAPVHIGKKEQMRCLYRNSQTYLGFK